MRTSRVRAAWRASPAPRACRCRGRTWGRALARDWRDDVHHLARRRCAHSSRSSSRRPVGAPRRPGRRDVHGRARPGAPSRGHAPRPSSSRANSSSSARMSASKSSVEVPERQGPDCDSAAPPGSGCRCAACDLEGARPSRGHVDGRHQVEPEPRQVDEVVAREGLAAQVRVHQPQAAEAAAPGAQAADVGQTRAGGRRRPRRTARCRRRASPSARPPAGSSSPRDLAQEGGELERDDLRRRDAATIDPLEQTQLARLEPGQVPRNRLHSSRGESTLGESRRKRYT